MGADGSEPGARPERGNPLPDGPEAHAAGEHPPPLVDGAEERPGLVAPDGQPSGHGGAGLVHPDVRESLPASLPAHPEGAGVRVVEVGELEGGGFRASEPEPVEDGEQGGVPRPGGRIRIIGGRPAVWKSLPTCEALRARPGAARPLTRLRAAVRRSYPSRERSPASHAARSAPRMAASEALAVATA